MNTWIVGNHPIGHHVLNFSPNAKSARFQPTLSKLSPNRLVSTSREEQEREEHGERVFFMKGRIMAGQPDISKNEYGDSEYQWLAKEEVQKAVSERYWTSIRNMLVER